MNIKIIFLGGYFYRYNIKMGFFSKIFDINSIVLVIENSMSILYLEYSFYIKKDLIKRKIHINKWCQRKRKNEITNYFGQKNVYF